VPGPRLGGQFRRLLLLGITSVDPALIDLLFERFISRERGSRPTSTSISNMNGAKR
jgi:hypothetical protein